MATGKNHFLAFHISGILIFLCLPLLFLTNGPAPTHTADILHSRWFWIFGVFYTGVFYCNAYWLFPKLYLKQQYLLYALLLLFLLALVVFIKPFDNIIQLAPPPNMPVQHTPSPKGNSLPAMPMIDMVSIFLFFIVLGLSLLVPVVNQWQQTRQQFITAQKDKAHAELSFLKAQINPHFLFNTLNNIYSLALTQSNKTPESILRLSNIMRYVTDEVQNDFVPLEDEIKCIKDFIELQTLRLNSKTKVQFTCTANLSLLIAPLILLPFTENVFKHGVSNNEGSVITITISSDEKDIIFYTKNNCPLMAKKENRSGTGLTNVQKRLQNLYPGKHVLKIDTSSIFFEVHLVINTHSI